MSSPRARPWFERRAHVTAIAALLGALVTTAPVASLHGTDEIVTDLLACITDIDPEVPDADVPPLPGQEIIHDPPASILDYVAEITPSLDRGEIDELRACVQEALSNTDRQFDVAVTSLSAEDPFILQERNAINATVKNRGQVPVNVTVVFGADNGTVQWRPQDHDDYSEQMLLEGDESKNVEIRWDGDKIQTMEDEGIQQPLRGDMTIRTWANLTFSGFADFDHEDVPDREQVDPPENNHRNISRQLVNHALFLDVADETKDSLLAGETTKRALTLRNEGNTPDEVEIQVMDHSPGWQAVLSTSSIQLAEGETKGFVLSLTAPEDAVMDSEGWADVRAVSHSAGHARQGCDEIEEGAIWQACEWAKVTTAGVEQDGNLSITTDPSKKQVSNANETRIATFDVDVKNLINAKVTSITLVPQKGREVTEDLDTSIWNKGDDTLEIGETQMFQMNVTVDPETTVGNFSWNLKANGLVEGDPEDPVVQLGPTVTVEVPPRRDIEIRINESASSPKAYPSTPRQETLTPIAFDVVNAGTAADDIQITSKDLPSGWAFGDGSDGPVTVHIPAPPTDEWTRRKTVNGFLEVPSTAEPGAQPVSFQATSQNDTSEDDGAVYAAFEVPEWVIPSALIQETRCGPKSCEHPIEEDASVEIQVQLKNVGNTADTFEVDWQNISKSPQQGWSVQANTSPVDLASGETAARSIGFASPSSLDLEDGLVGQAYLNATAPEHQDNTSSVEIHMFSAFPDLQPVSTKLSPKPVYRGVPGNLTVRVANNGTSPVSKGTELRVAYWDPTSGEMLNSSRVILPELADQGEGKTAQVTVPIPTDPALFDERSELSATITVDPEDNVTERGEANNEDQLSISPRPYDIVSKAPVAFQVQPGEAVSFVNATAFVVENAGPETEPVEVVLVSEPAWLEKTWNFTLEAGQSNELTGSFFVPDRPGVRNANFTLRTYHPDHPVLRDNATVSLFVEDQIGPSIGNLSADPDPPTVSSEVEFSARVADATGVASVKLFVIGPTGTVHQEPMTSDAESDRYRASHTFTDPGSYEWYVWARDATAEGHTSNTSGSSRTLKVTRQTDLTLSLVQPPEGALLGPHSNLTVAVEGTTGLRSVEYHVDNGTPVPVDPARPLQIPVGDWPTGNVTVQINAVDEFGSAAQASYSFVFDGDPPRISDLAIEPLDDGTGVWELTVQVEDESGIESVFARIQTESGVRDVPLTGNGSTYTAQLETAVSASEVTVVAIDEAGNRGTARETDLGMSRSRRVPGSLVPLDPALAVLGLAAAAGVKVAARRRRDSQG